MASSPPTGARTSPFVRHTSQRRESMQSTIDDATLAASKPLPSLDAASKQLPSVPPAAADVDVNKQLPTVPAASDATDNADTAAPKRSLAQQVFLLLLLFIYSLLIF
jgi:hypothetical protein